VGESETARGQLQASISPAACVLSGQLQPWRPIQRPPLIFDPRLTQMDEFFDFDETELADLQQQGPSVTVSSWFMQKVMQDLSELQSTTAAMRNIAVASEASTNQLLVRAPGPYTLLAGTRPTKRRAWVRARLGLGGQDTRVQPLLALGKHWRRANRSEARRSTERQPL
jgi:hypothetical protein